MATLAVSRMYAVEGFKETKKNTIQTGSAHFIRHCIFIPCVPFEVLIWEEWIQVSEIKPLRLRKKSKPQKRTDILFGTSISRSLNSVEPRSETRILSRIQPLRTP